jgi:hypothetical protein
MASTLSDPERCGEKWENTWELLSMHTLEEMDESSADR